MSSEEHSFGKGCFNILKVHYRGLIVFLTPLVFLPVMVLSEDKANRCMYLLMVMATYWITEVIPLAVTSMMPMYAFPLMDIMPASRTCELYFKDTLLMFVTSMMVANAIEYSGFHIRVAIKILQLVGCSPRRLHLGICIVTSFLSIWIANAACTAMMCPIIFAVLDQLSEQKLIQLHHEDDSDLPKAERRPSSVSACFFLSACFGSSIGGLGSLIGTPTNLALKGIYEGRFPHSEETMEFGTFMLYAIPSVIVCTCMMYLGLEIAFMGLFRPNSKDAKEIDIGKEGEVVGKQVIDEKYSELGPLNTKEITVALLFVILIILYIFRRPGFVAGWGDLFDNPKIKNSAPTITILVLIFSLPANYKFLKFWSPESLEKTPGLLTWEFIAHKIPWGLIFLVGGGAVLAEGSKVSGMATKLGNALTVLDFLPPTLLIFTCISIASLLTNFSANVAICNVLVPVFAELAVAMKIHPLYLVFPVGQGCSMAFLLPVGTPPNAIVQGYANIETKTMVYGGLFVGFGAVLGLWFVVETWGLFVYPNIKTFPSWNTSAEVSNDTLSTLILQNLWDDV